MVDDNVDAADTLGVLLEQSGHEVRVLYYGLDAVKTAMTFRPDVVLVDLDLPDITGHEVLMRLKESAPTRGCMAIALTGYGAHGDLQKSKDAGFDHHVVKPVEIGKLQQLLATALLAHRRSIYRTGKLHNRCCLHQDGSRLRSSSKSTGFAIWWSNPACLARNLS